MDRLEAIQHQATTLIRDLCLIVARYARGYQGPYRQFIRIYEIELQNLIIEMVMLSVEEEIDRQLEQQTWDSVC